MTLSPLVLALAALAASAGPAPIVILNAPVAAPAPTRTSDCAAGRPEAGADIECVLSLTPPRRDAEPAPPSRILIRAQWTPKPCPAREAQVVQLTRTNLRATRLPVVDHAPSARACGS